MDELTEPAASPPDPDPALGGLVLGGLVQQQRRLAGLTQEELARRSGVSVRALRDIEQNRVRQPRADSLRRIEAALRVTGMARETGWLAGGTRPPHQGAVPTGNRPRVGVLGPLTVTVSARTLTLGTAAQRSLLALLALRYGEAVSRDETIWVLWGDTPPKTCVAQVHTAVAQLRQVLHPGRARRDGGGAVRLEPGGYRLLHEQVQIDLADFEGYTERAQGLRTRGDENGELVALERALAQWRGPILVDASPRLTEHPRTLAAHRHRLAVALQYAEVALALGRYEPAAAQLWHLVRDEPYHEGLHAHLMRALAGLGERAAALRLFAAVRERLVEELGVEPGPELRSAHLELLRDEAGARISPTPTVVPVLLPLDIADFTGRTEAVARLRELLTAGGAALPVAAVAGMGGVGKTALAVHVAHLLAGSFPDGRLYVNLRGVEAKPADPAEVLARFLRALGVDSRAIPDTLDERVELYRTRLTDRRVLVVLDNAGSEEQIRPLLPGAASCAVLITSRGRLSGVEGARWLDLDVFSETEAIELLATIADDRVHDQFSAAAEVVRLCGGLPLALRIAGARLTARPMWRLADLSGMLADERRRLDRLATGDLEVRASLALSYTGLAEPGRRLLRLLSLLDVPDFPGWLAGAVLDCPQEEASRYLDQLVDGHLLSVGGSDAAGQHRYRFHDLVRLYARERAEQEDAEPERAGALARGLGGWLVYAEQLAEGVPGPCYAAIHGTAVRPALDPVPADLDSLVWFDAERHALVAAIRQACAADLVELAFDLAGCMEKYFDLRGAYGDWRTVNELVLRTCQAAGHRLGEAVMLRGLTDVVTWNTNHSSGEAMARLVTDATRLLELFTAAGDERGKADAEVILSWGQCAQGQTVEAGAGALRGLLLAEATGHLGGQARAHVALAVVASEQLKAELTLTHLRTALDLARELGNPRYEASVLQFLGIVYREVGDLDRSRDLLAEALVLARRYHDHYSEALTMLGLARLYLALGDPAASGAAQTALALGIEYHMTHHAADALEVLGEIEIADGRYPQAVRRLTESVRLWRTRGWPSFLAGALASLGAANRPIDPAAALAAWQEAAGIYRRLGRAAKAAQLDEQIAALTS